MTVKANDIAALVELFAASGWDELHVEADGIQLFLSTDPNARLVPGASPGHAPARPAPAAPSVSPPPAAAAPLTAQKPPASVTGEPPHPGWHAVKAPHLATFYRSPKPGAPPYVEIGQSVGPDTELCLLEVMKLFTALKAGVAGIIRQICVPDGELIEGEQILFYIEPS